MCFRLGLRRFLEGGADLTDGGHVNLLFGEEVGDSEKLEFRVFAFPGLGFEEARSGGIQLHGLRAFISLNSTLWFWSLLNGGSR